MNYKTYSKYKESRIGWIGKIPEHWEIKKVKYLTKNLDGRRIPISAENRLPGEIPYYGATGVVDYVDDYIFDEELLCVGEDGAPFFEANKNVSFIIRGKSWVNNHAHVLRVDKQMKIELLMHQMNTVDYSMYIKGSTRDKLNQDELKNIQIVLMPKNEQEKITRFLEKEISITDNLISKLQTQIELLNEYKMSLISHAVTGKIDLRE
jgi:type I restriction enzyme, S subunit